MKLLSVFLLIFFPFPLLSAEPITPSVDEIASIARQTVAEKFIAPSSARIRLIPQRLDNRFALPTCKTPIIGSLTSDQLRRNNTVKLTCEQVGKNYPWQVYISVTLDISYQVVTTSKPLRAGELITEDNVELKYINEASLRGGQFDSLSQVVGTRVNRRTAKGHPILKQNICFVCKGDDVAIFAKTQNLQIKTNGTALSNGRLHDVIKVKNLTSSRIIEARVIGIGEVEVRM